MAKYRWICPRCQKDTLYADDCGELLRFKCGYRYCCFVSEFFDKRGLQSFNKAYARLCAGVAERTNAPGLGARSIRARLKDASCVEIPGVKGYAGSNPAPRIDDFPEELAKSTYLEALVNTGVDKDEYGRILGSPAFVRLALENRRWGWDAHKAQTKENILAQARFDAAAKERRRIAGEVLRHFQRLWSAEACDCSGCDEFTAWLGELQK